MDDIKHVREILANRESRIALVGASAAPHKYGNIILKDLSARGYTMLPVNPRGGTLEGLPVARSLDELEAPISIINVVTHPEDSLAVVHGADPSLCDVIWFQPGAFDDEVVAAAHAKFPTVLAGDCIMVLARFHQPSD